MSDPALTAPRDGAMAGIAAGREINAALQAMPPARRGRRQPSRLKEKNVEADAAGEAIGIRHLERLSRRIGHRIELIVDPSEGRTLTIGKAGGIRAVWATLDAIDGTIKAAGLGNAPGRARLVNDGGWATGFAFTAPTEKRLHQLVLGDFVAAAIVDANPGRFGTFPSEAIAVPEPAGIRTYEINGSRHRRLFTTSSSILSRCMVFFDGFQAYDRNTSLPGDEALAADLYGALLNRHEGGAYDVLRQFGTLSALLRMMLGWRTGAVWREAQVAAFVIINENLFNLLPMVPIVRGAGGVSVDFEDQPLIDRKLSEGRTSVIHAANPGIRRQIVDIVRRARAG